MKTFFGAIFGTLGFVVMLALNLAIWGVTTFVGVWVGWQVIKFIF